MTLADDIEAVVNLLAEAKDGLTQDEIAKKTGWSLRTVNEALSPLTIGKKVVFENRRVKGRGKEVRYFLRVQ